VLLPSADQVVCDERGEPAAPGRLQFAGVLAQLGRDELVAEPLVQLLLGAEGVHLARLDLGDPVLGDRQAAALCLLAHRDVVVLRAGEVLEQVPVTLRRHHPKVEAEALPRDDGRLRPALGRDIRDPVEAGERVDQCLRIGGGGDDVQVAEGLPAAADAARFRHLLRGRVRAERLDRGEHRRQPAAEQRPRRRLRLRPFLQRLEDVLLDLRTQPGQRAQPLLLGGRAQLGQRGHAELEPDPPGRLRAEAGETHEGDHIGGDARAPLRQRLDLALLDDLDDLLLDRLPDPLQLLGPAVERQLRDGAAGLGDPLRGAPVGENAEGLLALELEHVGEELQLLDHQRVPRERRPHCRDHTDRAQSHRLITAEPRVPP
jgi:hypothetical protein